MITILMLNLYLLRISLQCYGPLNRPRMDTKREIANLTMLFSLALDYDPCNRQSEEER